MTALLLEPHQDDAILFASFLCLTHRPQVVTVLADARNQPGVTREMRDEENARAFRELGLDAPVPWPYRDDEPDWASIRADLQIMRDRTPLGALVLAPFPEPDGHPQHTELGLLARDVFGGRFLWYSTYRFGGPRTDGTEVPYERDWVRRKLRALACFESQILHGPVRFFTHSLEEFTREP